MMNDEHKDVKHEVFGKVVLRAYVSRDVSDRIRDLAWAKYGRFRGALSYEVEQALRAWLAQHAQDAHKNLEAVNPQPRAVTAFNRVKKYLEDRFGYAAIITGQQIPRQHLAEAIAAIQGVDNRTFKKWMDAFTRFKLIKYVGGEIFEVL
jgi:hypothetical protein